MFIAVMNNIKSVLFFFPLQPDDNQLAMIFMKVDANCDGTVDWVSKV